MKSAVPSLLNPTITVSLLSSASGAQLFAVPTSIGSPLQDVYPFVTITVAQSAYVTVGNVNSIAAAATVSSGTGSINAFNSITAGSGYTNATYDGVPLTGGTGTGAVARVIVSGGGVTSVLLTGTGSSGGTGYTAADALSASNTHLGGAGTGFVVHVQNLQPGTVTFSQGSFFLPAAGSYTYAIGDATYISVLNGTTTAAPLCLLFGTSYDKK